MNKQFMYKIDHVAGGRDINTRDLETYLNDRG